MKRAGLWAIGLGMLCIVGILTVKQGYSVSTADLHKCSVTTLKGVYLVSGIQYMVTPNTPTVQAYVAVAARTIYNGDGTSTNFARFTINGGGFQIDSTSPGIYTVDEDCKGTETHIDPVTGVHHEYVTIVSADGNEVHIVGIDPGVVLAFEVKRVER